MDYVIFLCDAGERCINGRYAAGMKLKEVIDVLRGVAPEHLAESWDKVGLHVGRLDSEISKALLCIDLTEAVLREAIDQKCQLIVAYHPPIFAPQAHLTEKDWKGRLLLTAVEAGVAIYSPHTALDAVRGGLGDWLCECVGEGRSRPIKAKGDAPDLCKVVVFVPENEVAAVREHMAAAGAGRLGAYAACSFESAGKGGFVPLAGANPSVGEVGARAEVAEVRLEMVCARSRLQAVVAALHEAHSYECPAYDLIALMDEPADQYAMHGTGRLLELDRILAPEELAARLKKALGVTVKLAVGECDGIRTVAVCPGAGGSLFEGVEADAYVTGEMQHHHVLDLVSQSGKCVVLAGHTHTERPYLPVYADLLGKAACAKIEWACSETDQAPFEYC